MISIAFPNRMKMRQKLSSGCAMACALALVVTSGVAVPQRAEAGNDLLKGLVIGAGVAAVANELNKQSRAKRKKATSNSRKKTRSTKRTKKRKSAPAGPRVTIASFPTTRTEVRDYQMRLNRLGFDTGQPDGLVGKKTRAGVSAFQASLGATQTGRLTEAQAKTLKELSDARLAGTGTTSGTGTQSLATDGQLATSSPTIKVPGQNAGSAAQGTDARGVQVATSSIPLLPTSAGMLVQKQSSLSEAGASAVTLEVFSLDDDLDLAEPAPTLTNFAVLDVRPGDRLDAAITTLSGHGARGCQTGGDVTFCSVDSSPTDQIAIRAVPDALGEMRVATIARHLQFVNPVPAEMVTARLQEDYGPLVNAPGRTMGGEGCEVEIGAARYDGAELYEAAVRADEGMLTQMASNCQSFARLSLNGPVPGQVGDLFIVLFDGTDLARRAPQQTPLDKIKF